MKTVNTILMLLAFFGLSVSSATAQDVYVGGYSSYKKIVWKNGTPIYTGSEGSINSVVVDNGALYVTGVEGDGTDFFATVWKDGEVLYTAAEIYSVAYSVVVSGNDVYMAGEVSDGGGGKVWKNGVAQSGYANAMVVWFLYISGDDLYAAGATTDNKAIVWKNGTALYTLTAGTKNVTKSVAIDDNGDVYTASYGSVDGTTWYPRVFKNDEVLYALGTTGTIGSFATSYPLGLYMSDGDIYVAGNEVAQERFIARLWKNGVQQPLNTNDLTANSFAYSIFVLDGDTYVAGTSDSRAVLWKNNEKYTILSSTYAGAYSVFVVPSSVSPPVITTTTLPDGAVGTPYSATLEATGDVPIMWSLESGSLPQGLTFYSNGAISGTPIATGTNTFTVKATNSVGSATATLAIAITATGITETTAEKIGVYPNPASEELIVDCTDAINSVCTGIEIFDIFGRSVYIAHPSRREGLSGLDISHLPSGIYFVRIATENGVVTRKVVKR